ncbi:MAG: hypothetical protein ACRC8J_07100 [Phocaeicola sp.]
MKYFACNKLYITPQLILPQSVVEVGEGGVFKSHFLLTEEVRATEWLGGIIFLSTDSNLARLSAFDAWDFFCNQSLVNSVETKYVFHLSPFDFTNNGCLPQTRIRRLQ